MPNYRRYRTEGATYFFTLVTDGREPLFADPAAVQLLGRVLRDGRDRWPFETAAMVLLPDHLHAVWTLPPGDDDYSRRWAWAKKEFTKAWLATGGGERPVSAGRQRDGRRGVWQPKFWEHMIRDQDDFEAHCDYTHYNPVRHGLVARVADWPHSTFARHVAAGAYPPEWGTGLIDPRFAVIAGRAGE